MVVVGCVSCKGGMACVEEGKEAVIAGELPRYGQVPRYNSGNFYISIRYV